MILQASGNCVIGTNTSVVRFGRCDINNRETDISKQRVIISFLLFTIMLQTFLAFAIPTVVALTAAFFVFRKIKDAEENQGMRSGSDGRRGHVRHTTSARYRHRPAESEFDSECAICFETRRLVQLYPCGHQTFCGPCIDHILSFEKHSCPLCRKPIKGYSP